MFTKISDIERLFGTMNLLQKRLDSLYRDYVKSSDNRWQSAEKEDQMLLRGIKPIKRKEASDFFPEVLHCPLMLTQQKLKPH